MLQQVIVGFAVLAAAAYVAWSLTPARTRVSMLSRLDTALARREAAAGGRVRAGTLRTRVVAPLLRRAQPPGGCASCGADKPAGGAPRLPRGPGGS